tara:strand:+ start:279 stop:422 length:144 start_codon:yes stop_codon:yes gene_type:complete
MKGLTMKVAYKLLGIKPDRKLKKLSGNLCSTEEFYQLGVQVAHRKDY